MSELTLVRIIILQEKINVSLHWPHVLCMSSCIHSWLVLKKHQFPHERIRLNIELDGCCRTLKMLEITGCDGAQRDDLV
jgi:hypothetical protein